jgi:PPOX class probable F420-dependent enzyme
MSSLDAFATLSQQVDGLCVVSTLRADGTIQTSLVNAGVLSSPLDGAPSVAFVTYGKVKLANLRARPQLTLTTYAGWQWAAVEGQAVIIGPDDPHPDFDADRLRLLLREVFTGAGGTHDNWDEYDRVLREQRRAAVIVTPARTYPA